MPCLFYLRGVTLGYIPYILHICSVLLIDSVFCYAMAYASAMRCNAVWLPTSGNTSWLSWLDGLPVAMAKSHWFANEIPIFIRSSDGGGAIVPLRTSASTYSSFADPMIWAIWTNNALHSTANYTLYEDSGDGLDYQSPSNGTFSTTDVLLGAGSGGPTSVAFVVQPAVGTFRQQKSSRQHLVQLRGRAGVPKSVVVAGKSVGRVTSGAAATGASGWFVAEASQNNRDEFTMPAGVLVFATGAQSIRKRFVVEVDF